MSSSEESEQDDGFNIDHLEIERNVVGQLEKFNHGFESGWDDGNDDIEEEKNPCDSGCKEMLWAIHNSDIDTVQKCLNENPNVINVTDKDGYTPLHRAAYNNNLEILNLLLKNGADYNAVTVDGWTPLHSACHWNSASCVERLFCYDINVNAKSKGGVTPLHLAALNISGLDTLQLLLLHPNIDTTIGNKSDETAQDIAYRKTDNGRYFEINEPCFNFL